MNLIKHPFTDDELFGETLRVATVNFAEKKNPFWGSVKESYLDRIRGSIEKKLPNVKIEKKTRIFDVNGTKYIWRNDGDIWNIALESMHTPPDISKQVVEESGRNWLEYSLQICAKLGFTSVGDDYLKEAVAVWDEKTCWSDPEEPEIVYVMLDNKDVGSATWDHYPTGGDWVKR